jgi:hypothetical protein
VNPERQLRRRCRALLQQLDIRPPLDVPQLCARLGEHRGRPIYLQPAPIPLPGPFGIWLSLASSDVIVYQEETSRTHQKHIILHELAHLVAGHSSDEDDDGLLRAMFPTIDPEMVRRMLRRTSYDSRQEREAETVATIILEWASVLDSITPRLPYGAPGQNMQDALGDRVGWL